MSGGLNVRTLETAELVFFNIWIQEFELFRDRDCKSDVLFEKQEIVSVPCVSFEVLQNL